MTRRWRLRATGLVVAVALIVAACQRPGTDGTATPRGASAAPPAGSPGASVDPEAPVGTIEVPPPIR
jgi:hypothetical protein